MYLEDEARQLARIGNFRQRTNYLLISPGRRGPPYVYYYLLLTNYSFHLEDEARLTLRLITTTKKDLLPLLKTYYH